MILQNGERQSGQPETAEGQRQNVRAYDPENPPQAGEWVMLPASAPARLTAPVTVTPGGARGVHETHRRMAAVGVLTLLCATAGGYLLWHKPAAVQPKPGIAATPKPVNNGGLREIYLSKSKTKKKPDTHNDSGERSAGDQVNISASKQREKDSSHHAGDEDVVSASNAPEGRRENGSPRRRPPFRGRHAADKTRVPPAAPTGTTRSATLPGTTITVPVIKKAPTGESTADKSNAATEEPQPTDTKTADPKKTAPPKAPPDKQESSTSVDGKASGTTKPAPPPPNDPKKGPQTPSGAPNAHGKENVPKAKESVPKAGENSDKPNSRPAHQGSADPHMV